MSTLNERNTDQAYNYGRLLAMYDIVLDALQDVMDDVVLCYPGVVDTFLDRALTRPAHAFPDVYKRGQRRLSMMRSRDRDLHRSFQSHIDQIVSNIACSSLPERWSDQDACNLISGVTYQQLAFSPAAESSANL